MRSSLLINAIACASSRRDPSANIHLLNLITGDDDKVLNTCTSESGARQAYAVVIAATTEHKWVRPLLPNAQCHMSIAGANELYVSHPILTYTQGEEVSSSCHCNISLSLSYVLCAAKLFQVHKGVVQNPIRKGVVQIVLGFVSSHMHREINSLLIRSLESSLSLRFSAIEQ